MENKLKSIIEDLSNSENYLVLGANVNNDRISASFYAIEGLNMAILSTIVAIAIEDKDFYDILKGAIKLIEQEKLKLN